MEKTVSNYIVEMGKQVFSEGSFKTIYAWFNEVIQYVKDEIRREMEEQDN